ncbi:rhomboid family intramembrane serine protease [Streptomyces sp. NPDC048172]|uniref:rhomboid family intramembrane serine protease n=1 Tax=Streptomyces sp. NPDC048172 TaxID=3365505 RepID=UPI00371B4900
MHTVLLYGCAAVVVVTGVRLLAAFATTNGPGGAEVAPPLALLRTWQRPVPKAAAGLVAAMVVLGVAQEAFPAMVEALERHPHGAWWRAVTALAVQSSGWFQLLFNLAALAAVAPVAERKFGPWRTLFVFAASGVAAQAVSMASWSPRGGGDSVAVCGLVGALAVRYAVRGDVLALRRAATLVPAAGLVLGLLTDNHGVGILVGCALGAGMAIPARPPLAA